MRPIFLHRYNLYIYISGLDYIYLSKVFRDSLFVNIIIMVINL